MTISSILQSGMAQETKRFSVFAMLFTTFLSLQLIPTVISIANAPAASPLTSVLFSWIARNNTKEHQYWKDNHSFHHTVPDKPGPSPAISPLDLWIANNIKEHQERKPNIAHGYFNRTVVDKALLRAEDSGFKVIKVKKDGTGDFDTLTAAVNSIPFANKQRIVVWIGGGDYFEKIAINVTKDFVTFYGDPTDMPKIVYNGTAATFGTVNSATVAVESDYFIAVNIIFMNSAPMPDGNRTGEQAVALRISGDKAAFHNCKFIGFQDTLCDDRGMHFFRDCYIEGTVDFIFGNGKSLYLNTTIKSVARNVGVITAQARETVADESGFAFLYCNIVGVGNSTTYLGRAWKLRPKVVFAYSYMGTIIKSEGWSTEKHPERNGTVYYGEYRCTGPGATSYGRVGYAKVLTSEEIKPFLSVTYIHGSNWLFPPPTVEKVYRTHG